MEEYIRILLEQIRCQKARPMIEREIRQHIEDQTEANRAAGMEDGAALASAVRDMGDPVEAGVSLDRIHRPALSVPFLILLIGISLCNLFIHTAIGLHESSPGGMHGNMYIANSVLHVLLGFAAMLLICRLDYTFFARYAKYFLAFLYLFLYGQIQYGLTAYGRIAYLGPFSVSLLYLSFLCVPLYGAVLYRYRGSGRKGLCRCFLWMLPSFLVCRMMPCLSQGILLFLLQSILLSAAIVQGWFSVSRKKFLTGYWGVLLLLPLITLFCALHIDGLLATYQVERLRVWLSGSPDSYNYIQNLLASLLEHARLFGAGSPDVSASLPEYHTDYILTYICSVYGIVAALFFCLLLLAVCLFSIRFSLRQGSLPGRMIGLGCGLVFLSSLAVNVLETLGLLPLSQTFLPFISYGESELFISYILMGLVLSVYRFQRILPSEPA